METLTDRMRQANQLLAPFAVPHEGTLGRVHAERQDTMRFPFQRDRDRILHTQAFRRLQGKTQVFAAGEGDHFRTRLTHTMEVAQIGRDLARALRLNEDLTECIALAHDLGHPPFGHSGEDALHAWMREHPSTGLRVNGFEHNEQSHRIVTLLEEHSSAFPGLNLQQEVLEGLLKHSGRPVSLEAELVNRADEIGYMSHDCDDGLLGGLFRYDELIAVPLAAWADEARRERKTSIRGALLRILAEDLITTFSCAHSSKLTAQSSSSFAFSPPLQAEIARLRSFLEEHMYFHPSIRLRTDHGKDIITFLCRTYLQEPPAKIHDLQERTGSPLFEAVKDYIAGMTDTYAETQAAALGLR